MQSSQAIVIATYSRRMRLRLADGRETDARIKGRQLRPVCGDRVRAEALPQEQDWLITAILDRDNELTRPNARGGTEILAANVDLLLATAAAAPAPDWFVIDRYLAAAEAMQTRAAVLFNKSDLYAEQAEVEAILQAYESLDYTVIPCSATTASGLDALQQLLADRTGIIVGQSGVGKSSIVNALLGQAELRTGEISQKLDAGRHTTVNSVMLDLPGGGSIIDSPGVRDFAPALPSLAAVSRGFREIADAAQDCRFANCLHTREPDCAVKAAALEGAVSARRYDSYKRLLNVTRRVIEQN